jgi:hypothetical protein
MQQPLKRKNPDAHEEQKSSGVVRLKCGDRMPDFSCKTCMEHIDILLGIRLSLVGNKSNALCHNVLAADNCAACRSAWIKHIGKLQENPEYYIDEEKEHAKTGVLC